MKYSILYFLLLILISQSSFAQPEKITQYKPDFKTRLNGWTRSFSSFDLSSFNKNAISSFENIGYMDVEDTADFYSIYKPALAFSPDKNQFIDIYSYWLNLQKEGDTIVSRGGEADQAVTLCNFKTGKWVRILFRGTTERIQDVVWISNSTFILVGVREDDSSHDLPIIYLGNTATKELVSYLSTDKRSSQKKGGYDSPKLLKLKIKDIY